MSRIVCLAALLTCTSAAAEPTYTLIKKFYIDTRFSGPLVSHGPLLFGAESQGRRDWNGSLFTLSPPAAGGTWAFENIYDFGLPDASGHYSGGVSPFGTFVVSEDDHILGTTAEGFYPNSQLTPVHATIYDVHRSIPHGGHWTQTTLKTFAGGKVGSRPTGDLVSDAAGNLFGSVQDGGACSQTYGCGYVFGLSRDPGKQSWSFTDIYDFNASIPDGAGPTATLVAKSGKVYVSTSQTIVELTPPRGGSVAWNGKTIWTSPISNSYTVGMVSDAHGNLFVSEMVYGPYPACNAEATRNNPPSECGEVFELTRPTQGDAWSYSIIAAFYETGPVGSPRGFPPLTAPIIDKNGVLFLGAGYTYFSLTPPTTSGGAWTSTLFPIFTDMPYGLVAYDDGNLFGLTNVANGPYDSHYPATAFELSGSGYVP